MKKFLAVLSLLLSFNLSFAGDETDKIKKEIKWLYPNLTIKAVEKSIIPGVYEIYTGEKVFYTDGRFIIIGAVISPEGKNITNQRLSYYKNKYGSDDKELQKILDSLDISKGLKIGDGKKIVIEISDPECPFCRRAEKFFENKDVSRYVFFMPLSFHRKAKPLAVHILCSKNPEKTYHEVMEGKYDNLKNLNKCKKGEEILEEMELASSQLKVKGTPAFFIKTDKGWKKIVGANPEISNYLKNRN